MKNTAKITGFAAVLVLAMTGASAGAASGASGKQAANTDSQKGTSYAYNTGRDNRSHGGSKAAKGGKGGKGSHGSKGGKGSKGHHGSRGGHGSKSQSKP